MCGVDNHKLTGVVEAKTIVSTYFYGGNNLIAVEFFCLKATDPNAGFIVPRNFQKVFLRVRETDRILLISFHGAALCFSLFLFEYERLHRYGFELDVKGFRLWLTEPFSINTAQESFLVATSFCPVSKFYSVTFQLFCTSTSVHW